MPAQVRPWLQLDFVLTQRSCCLGRESLDLDVGSDKLRFSRSVGPLLSKFASLLIIFMFFFICLVVFETLVPY